MKIAIVTDGKAWFVRRIASSTHDAIHDEKIYYCDKPIGTRYKTLDAAVVVAKKAMKRR